MLFALFRLRRQTATMASLEWRALEVVTVAEPWIHRAGEECHRSTDEKRQIAAGETVSGEGLRPCPACNPPVELVILRVPLPDYFGPGVPIRVFELEAPGDEIDLERDLARNIETRLDMATGALGRAVVSAGFLEWSRTLDPDDSASHEQDWEERRLRRSEYERAIETQHGREAVYQDSVRTWIDRRMQHEDYARGVWPRQYAHEIPFLFARAFVSALVEVRRMLTDLRLLLYGGDVDREIVSKVDKAINAFDQAAPDLVDVRDSLEHWDDRLKRRVKKQELTTRENEDIPGFIKAENSVSMLIGPSLYNQTLHVTIAERPRRRRDE